MRNAYVIDGDDVNIILRRHNGNHMITVIDKKDLPKLLKLDVRWYAGYNRGNNAYYATCKAVIKGKNRVLKLHRYLMSAPRGKEVDHFNHNTLNNKRNNLRLVNTQQNAQNRQRSRNNSSGVDGVYWNKDYEKWHCRIQVNGKRKHLGYYKDLNEACRVVDEARARYMPYSQQAASRRLQHD